MSGSTAGFGATARADFRRRALRQHAAGVQDRHAVAVFGFLHEMRGDDHGDALLGERGDPLPEFAPGERIGAAGGLVEKQDLAARAATPPPWRVAACSRRAIARWQAGRMGRSSNCCIAQSMRSRFLPAAQTVGAGKELKILRHRELAIEREFLRDIADPLARRRLEHSAGRSRPPARFRRWPATGRRACGRWSSCRPRSARADRRSRRGGPRTPTWSTAVKVPKRRTRSRTSTTTLVIVSARRGAPSCAIEIGRSFDGLPQQHHEAVFEPRRHRLDPSVLKRTAKPVTASAGRTHDAHLPGFGHGIDHVRIMQQPRLQSACGLPGRRFRHEGALGARCR